ncbi:MAG: hypothetical protein KGI90_04955, partial [Burkholderiales bacterium]|nr:hypothetical protein [Burkholderiales bacterium]
GLRHAICVLRSIGAHARNLHAVMTHPIIKKLCSALLALAAGLGAVGSAQGALVTGRLDPLFGSVLTGTSFAGTATFSIADACLSLLPANVGAFIYQSYNCGGGGSGMSFLGAQVNFSTPSPSPLIGSVTFAPDAPGSSSILGMYVKDGQVLGIQSSANPLIGTSTSLGGYSFYLLFGTTNPVIGTGENHPPGPESSNDGDLDDQPLADLQQSRLFVAGETLCTGNAASTGCASSSSNVAATTFETPEPGSLALALGALTLGLVVRRRAPRRG